MANAINSLKFGSDTYTFTLPYGTCSTAAGTAAKTVDVDNFSLETGARVLVKFTVTNTASSPTLNVESTGAKAIYYRGSAVSAGYLAANRTYEFVYNGTQWDLIGDLDTNTTYSAAGSSLGLVKSGGDVTISSGTITVNDDSHNHVISNVDGLQAALDGKAASGHTHNYAGSSSAGGAATSANKVNSSLTVKLNGGSTEDTNLFTFNGSAAKSVNITPSAIGAAASSHGNHVPATETANNAKFLRNDNTWQTVTPANIGAAASSHGTHVSYSTTAPVMDGTASAGSASTVARSDHKHPTDTSRAAASDLTSHTGNKSNPHEVTASQVGAVPVSRTVNGKALSGDISLTASDVGAATSGHTHSDYAPKYTYSTTDLTAGTSSLTTGKLYFVYE